MATDDKAPDPSAVDWTKFDGFSENTNYCDCGAVFRSHAKFVMRTGLVSRKPCPACARHGSIRKSSSDPAPAPGSVNVDVDPYLPDHLFAMRRPNGTLSLFDVATGQPQGEAPPARFAFAPRAPERPADDVHLRFAFCAWRDL